MRNVPLLNAAMPLSISASSLVFGGGGFDPKSFPFVPCRTFSECARGNCFRNVIWIDWSVKAGVMMACGLLKNTTYGWSGCYRDKIKIE